MPAEESRDSGSLHYHYSRSERLGAGGPPPPPQGILRRNRSLAIILLDLLLLVLIFAIYRLVLVPRQGERLVGDYRVELSAFSFDAEVYLTVGVTRVTAGEPPDGERSLIAVRFPDQEPVMDVLPVAEGRRMDVRQVVTGASAERIRQAGEVRVEVDLLGQTVELRRQVSGDSSR